MLEHTLGISGDIEIYNFLYSARNLIMHNIYHITLEVLKSNCSSKYRVSWFTTEENVINLYLVYNVCITTFIPSPLTYYKERINHTSLLDLSTRGVLLL